MECGDEPRLAVLIDAENTAAKWADAIFEEIATLGVLSPSGAHGVGRVTQPKHSPVNPGRFIRVFGPLIRACAQ